MPVLSSEIYTIALAAEATPVVDLVVERTCRKHGTAISTTGVRIDVPAATVARTGDRPSAAGPLDPADAARLSRLLGHPKWAALLAEPPPVGEPHPGMRQCAIDAAGQRLSWPTDGKFSSDGEVFLGKVRAEIDRIEAGITPSGG